MSQPSIFVILFSSMLWDDHTAWRFSLFQQRTLHHSIHIKRMDVLCYIRFFLMAIMDSYKVLYSGRIPVNTSRNITSLS